MCTHGRHSCLQIRECVCVCVCNSDSITTCVRLRSENNNLSPNVCLYVLPQCFCRLLLFLFLFYFFRAAFVLHYFSHTVTLVVGSSSCLWFRINIQPPSLMFKISPTSYAIPYFQNTFVSAIKFFVAIVHHLSINKFLSILLNNKLDTVKIKLVAESILQCVCRFSRVWIVMSLVIYYFLYSTLSGVYYVNCIWI